jgi:hypothetical protein
MGKHRTHYRLWTLLTVGAWGGLLAVDNWATRRVLRGLGVRLIPDRPGGFLVIDVCNALCMVLPAAGVGGLAQALAVVRGVCLSGRPAPAQAGNYDDALPSPTID